MSNAHLDTVKALYDAFAAGTFPPRWRAGQQHLAEAARFEPRHSQCRFPRMTITISSRCQ